MQNSIAGVLVAGFTAGILLRSFVDVGLFVCALFCYLGLLLLATALVHKNKTSILAGVLLVAISAGLLRMHIAQHEMHPYLQTQVGSEIHVEGSVVAEPDVRDGSQRITVEIDIEGDKQKILVVAEPYPTVRYGDIVSVSGVLAVPEPFSSAEGRVFAYDAFLAKDEIFGIVYRPRIEIIGTTNNLYAEVRRALSIARQHFFDAMEVALPEPHASLAQGLVMGGKQGLGAELLDAFTLAGLVHIVVLSGYNVMIVAEMVLRSLGFLQRRIAAIVALAVISLFVLAAGAGPASIRAGIMAGLSLLARFTNRTYDVVRALLAAMVLMLLHSPYLLVYDPGFQLSFIATVGLVVGVPILQPLFQWIPSVFIRDMVTSTLAAQTAVLPLLLYQTGLFSLVSFPANILVLPAIPVAMLLSVVAAIAGMLAPSLAAVCALPAYLVLEYVIRAAEISATIPFAGISVPAFPFWVTLLAYTCLIVLVIERTLLPLRGGVFFSQKP